MYATRRALFSNPAPKAQRLNYEGDVKTMQHKPLGFNISFDTKTGMPLSITTTQTKKAFCKVCHDAGKPEDIYTSHFVRASPSPDAHVVCPTLLAQPCRYCGIAGHTVKYCPTIQNNNTYTTPVLQQVPSLPNQEEFQAAFVKHAKQLERNMAKDAFIRSANAFAALSLDDDDSSSNDDIMSVTASDNTTTERPEYCADAFDELNLLSKDSLFTLLDAVLQLNPTSDNKLIIALEQAISKKEQKKTTATRPPFCSPTPVPFKIEKKDWADCEDDEECDFNTTLSLPNFPPLPAPAAKRTYAEMAKQ